MGFEARGGSQDAVYAPRFPGHHSWGKLTMVNVPQEVLRPMANTQGLQQPQNYQTQPTSSSDHRTMKTSSLQLSTTIIIITPTKTSVSSVPCNCNCYFHGFSGLVYLGSNLDRLGVPWVGSESCYLHLVRIGWYINTSGPSSITRPSNYWSVTCAQLY